MMKRVRLPLIGLALVAVLLLGSWAIYSCRGPRLSAVAFQCRNGTSFRTEAPEALAQVEAWCRSIEGPSVEQRLTRFTGTWVENGLRQPDYEVTLVFRNGQRQALAVWVYAKDYVPVYTGRWSGTSGGRGESCLARREPFTALARSMQSTQG
jgi:hypothetical protein